MRKIIFILLIYPFWGVSQNIAVNESGNSPNTNAILDVNADVNHNKGVLLPRLTTAQRTGLSLGASDAGLTVYDTDTKSYWWWEGSQWYQVGIDGRYWSLTGNSGTTAGTNFLGTTDAVDLVFKTNNTEYARITSGGNVGIGTTNPQKKLEIGSGYAIRTPYLDAGNRSSSYEFIRFGASDEYWAGFMHNINSASYGNGDDFTIYTYGNRDIVIRPGNGQTHILGGNVGIGTTSPSSKLEIYGSSANIEISNTTESDAGIIFNDAQATSSQYAKITYGSSDNDLNFLNASSTPRMVIKSNGNVGIGTTSPGAKLHVNGSFRLTDGSQGDGKVLVSDANGTATWQTLSQNTYGTNNQGVSGTTDITLNTNSWTDMDQMTITFTPVHSVVYVYFTFSAYADPSYYPMEYVDFRILKDGTNVGGSNCLVEDYDDYTGLVTSFNGAMSLAVPVTPGQSTTIKVQWRRDGLYTSPIYCNPASEPEYSHRSLIIVD